MTEPSPNTPEPTHDSAIAELCKSLINLFIRESAKAHGDTPMDKMKSAARYDGNEAMWSGITALSAYQQARAAERQAVALETIARNAADQQRTTSANTDAQALIDQRKPLRDHLATTYSLPTKQLSLLWAMRGMLMDAAIKSLSRPASFEPYERVSTEEVAWSLRMTVADFYATLPHQDDGIDFRLLEEFGIFSYSSDPARPDDWMYGG